MNALYVETSAVLAWLFDQDSGEKIAREADSAEVIVTSALTFAEVERAIRRVATARAIKEADEARLRGLLARERARWIAMAVTDTVLDRAGRPFPIEPVRTLDGIHLATALALIEALPDLRMLTLDRRVGENAIALGLA